MSEELSNILKTHQNSKLLEQTLLKINTVKIIGFVTTNEQKFLDVDLKYQNMISISSIPLDQLPIAKKNTDVLPWLKKLIKDTDFENEHSVYLKISELFCPQWMEIQVDELSEAIFSILGHLQSKDITLVSKMSTSVLAIFEEEDYLEAHFRS
jgi:hypothetical protein